MHELKKQQTLAGVDCWLSFVNFVRYLVKGEMPLLPNQTGVVVVEVLHCEAVVVVAAVVIAVTTTAGGDDEAADVDDGVVVDDRHRYFHHRCAESVVDVAGAAAMLAGYDAGDDGATDDGCCGVIDYSSHRLDRQIVFDDLHDVNCSHHLSFHQPNDDEGDDDHHCFGCGKKYIHLADHHPKKMKSFWCWSLKSRPSNQTSSCIGCLIESHHRTTRPSGWMYNHHRRSRLSVCDEIAATSSALWSRNSLCYDCES